MKTNVAQMMISSISIYVGDDCYDWHHSFAEESIMFLDGDKVWFRITGYQHYKYREIAGRLSNGSWRVAEIHTSGEVYYLKDEDSNYKFLSVHLKRLDK